jgi:DUF4097 and DUF4098 domain-containing protein YvlB
MAKKQIKTNPSRIELDFSDSILELTISAGNEVILEWDEDETGALETTENDGVLTIAQPFDQDETSIRLVAPPATTISIMGIDCSIEIEDPWAGDISVTCANEAEFECSQAGNVSLACETGSIEIGTCKDLAIQTQDADIALGSVTGNLAIDSEMSDIEIENAGTCTIRSISGDIEIGTSGNLTVQSLAGNITVEECKDATIENTSGDIELGVACGTISIKTVSSDIAIGDLDTANTHIDNVSGSVSIDLLKISEGEFILKSVSSDVSIGLHGEASAAFNLKSNAGEITTPEGDESGCFTMGDGKARVSITTISGSIELE